ncbi:endonuclease [Planococcus halotolerans]|uniref:Endonuclease n=1 Tax=Planococcus halotolerans TaxID=2233542 RepID=A0A365KQT1_9BACL|nr:endonuclease [Planococcus halotolerans]QHJ69584.1 endonuclease [Planococcus halotolerans]RAZ75533.1 endonuclease [Planococcus halotolerans]
MHDLICGKLLGDGCLTKEQNRKPRFQFTHCIKDKGWSNYCYEQLGESLPLTPPKYRKLIDSRMKLGYTESFIVQSRTSIDISFLYEVWYPSGKKELPLSYIGDNFTDRSLAWWYQDDGHLKLDGDIPRKIILSTDSFSKEENLFLQHFLQEKYGFRFSLDGQNRLLLYDQFQIYHFLYLVEPYLHDSMNRKKRPTHRVKPIAARTTVYLPDEIILAKPTKEVNSQYSKLPLIIEAAKNQDEFFRQNIASHQIPTKSYQIVIHPNYRESLQELKLQTGLTVSQLTTCCFRMEKD